MKIESKFQLIMVLP